MSRRRTLLPVDNDDAFATDAETETETASDTEYESDYEGEPEQFLTEPGYEDAYRPARFGWVVPTLAIFAVLGWTGFFGWIYRDEILAGASPQQWADWIVAWCVPVLLIVGMWLLAMRNSGREAARFGGIARQLSDESALLESRLAVVNRELSLAREFIASQTRDLESLGRVATERLSTNADHLQTLIHDNSTQLDSIKSVGETAVSNMEKVRDQLPVLSSAARDMSNQIGNAGNIAQTQVETLVEAFDRLNQFGETGELHVQRVNDTVTSTLAAFDRQVASIGEVTQARFRKLREVSDTFRADLVESEDAAFETIKRRAEELSLALTTQLNAQQELEDDALSNMRERIASVTAEGEALLAKMGDGREQAASAWSEAISALEGRTAEAFAELTRVDETAMANARTRLAQLAAEAERFDERNAQSISAFDSDMDRRRAQLEEREAAEIAALETKLTELDARITERQEEHLAHVAGLAERGEALSQRLAEIDTQIGAIASQGDITREELSESAALLGARISESRSMLDDSGTLISSLTDDSVRLLEIIRSSADHTQGALAEAVGQAEARLTGFGEEAARLHTLISEAEERGATLAGHIETANTGGSATLEQLRDMESQVATLAAESERLAERTGSELREALELLAASSTTALEGLRDDQSSVLDDIAAKIASESRERISDAIKADAASTISELEAAVVRASENGRDTAVGLRNQLAKLNELVTNLEQRVTYARDRAEEKVDSDFSRRMALITEALNSAAIDIAKAFDNEVSDTQWANYLKGDRGIFTRRAVRLLDKQDARSVAEIYGEDSEFRETVNRFIHDFEAMLREVLATRDGNAIAVTLLSSDTGKLYVALAQAIDRLRN
ncbi:coiled-coil domain-containing protein [Aurantiacibacter sediminis]|uniref:ATPase n=1 Tax=Aurantiacibacter sediminis TaxID=2793064 RepID=A0ABS0N418_9SPHN|nr:ATPase [Aurantiacibacter sediminis]MBH5322716.1 ATPase [Aurantiacibacter sediminis]